ncbi:MAG TPA: preprotein translocase subunit YajC [Candidatus Methylacidiphilales bacterium]|jgi:preprotein translocase subunit YajC|nr:preprotein translocase subunit YajC [Candidatus Methylacidiphilales bacterium]
MSSSPIALFFAQVTNAAGTSATPAAAASAAGTDATAQQGPPLWIYLPLFVLMIYFGLIRPQAQAKKKAEETIKSAKTGDKIVTSSGIHGVITNVKDTTVIVRVADNVKLEIEKSHIDKITRPDSGADPEKAVTAKVS